MPKLTPGKPQLYLGPTELSGHMTQLPRNRRDRYALSMSGTRTETDSMGEIQVAEDRYWGAQTQRSIQNFPIGRDRFVWGRAIIEGLGLLKAAAGQANGENWVGCGGFYTGVFERPWLDIPPTQHAVAMRYHEFFRFVDGKVVEYCQEHLRAVCASS